jgi:hypothetical protein
MDAEDYLALPCAIELVQDTDETGHQGWVLRSRNCRVASAKEQPPNKPSPTCAAQAVHKVTSASNPSQVVASDGTVRTISITMRWLVTCDDLRADRADDRGSARPAPPHARLCRVPGDARGRSPSDGKRGCVPGAQPTAEPRTAGGPRSWSSLLPRAPPFPSCCRCGGVPDLAHEELVGADKREGRRRTRRKR